MRLRFFGLGFVRKFGNSSGRSAVARASFFAALALATGIAAACANGSSTGIRETSDGGGDDDDDDAATNTATIGMPIVSSDDAAGFSTLPEGNGGDDASNPGTTVITLGDDDGGEGGAGEGGTRCALVNPSGICGLTPQCNCSPTQTCDVTDPASGGVSCVTAGNTVQGDKCAATSDCAVGLTCVLGACRPFCYGETVGSACVGQGLGSCAQLYGAKGAITNDYVCFVSCDLTSPSTACGSNGCVNGGGETNCVSVGTGEEFDTCANATSCGPGLGCITIGSGDAGTSTCHNWCKIAPTTSACPSGETCTPFTTSLVLNGATYGFCQ